MGHKTVNSGAFRQRFAAFRDWKLVEGKGDRIRLTDTAWKLAHSSSEVETAKAALECLQAATLFWQLYTDLAKGIEIALGTISSRAVLDLRVAPGSKDRFVLSFVESATVAGVAERVGADKVVLKALASEDKDEILAGAAVGDQSTSRAAGARVRPDRGFVDRDGATLVVDQRWPVTGGEVALTISLNRALPSRVFGDLGTAVSAVEVLANALTADAPQPQSAREGEPVSGQ